MSKLAIEDFGAFFQAVYGSEPFPWQERLARLVAKTGRWPDVLDLPTGVGKTATLDVAVFALALSAEGKASGSAPRRIVFVVDRRVVVDQAHDRAATIAKVLGGAKSGVLKTVAAALRRLSGSEDPLRTVVLRGGLARDDGWAETPDQPLLVLSTVDQVGSRLMFRGYGVSERMRPIHAGLLGNDVLYLLDEVHLSEPFAETLDAVGRYRPLADTGLPAPWGVVRMSATPGARAAGHEVFGLDNADRRNPVLARRLAASKPATRELVAIKKGAATSAINRRMAEASVNAALDLVKQGLGTIAIVLNRVDAAREAYRTLEGSKNVDAALLTGRMRSLDRDVRVAELVPRVEAGRERPDDARPLVLVATQCIEAGADFDFDGLVTECASLDALRQRFGRLNRRGDRTNCAARILARGDQVSPSADPDPVYGEALGETWRWLEAQAPSVDFGVDALALPEGDHGERLRSRTRRAPVLLPAHLDAWAQTSPAPFPDPEVSHWLHGPERGGPEVQLVWRADLQEASLRDARGGAARRLPGETPNETLEAIRATLQACPPGSLETLAVPISAARSWLKGLEAPSVADVEGAVAEEGEKARRDSGPGRLALRWSGDESEVVRADELQPGDTLVVPATYGGLTAGNWDPQQKETPVTDLGDAVQTLQRGRATLRLHPRVLAPWLDAKTIDRIPQVPSSDDVTEDSADAIDEWVKIAGGSAELPPWLSHALVRLAPRKSRRSLVVSDGTLSLPRDGAFFVLSAKRRDLGLTNDVTTEDDTSAFTSAAITLLDHSRDVESEARGFAERVGLPEELVSDLALTGWLHDVGKADPRFQRMLCGGSEVSAAMLDAPLAKSAIAAQDARARSAARRESGYPRGTRHELLSVALVEDQGEIRARANDWDLVLHLVASHHGWCRPFAPALDDPAPREVVLKHGDEELRASSDHRLARLDRGVPDRFWMLVRRYGWFGLAWLEAILRLADHRASAREQEV